MPSLDMDEEFPDCIIVSSDRFRDLGPYCTRTFHSNPKKWGEIFPWEFPQHGSRQAEEDFLRQHFSAVDIHMQGGALGEGHGFRFLKQVWYSIAIFNAEHRIPAAEKWWWAQPGSTELLENAEMVERMLSPEATASNFGIAPEVTDMYGEKFLFWLIRSIQHTTFKHTQKLQTKRHAKTVPRDTDDASTTSQHRHKVGMTKAGEHKLADAAHQSDLVLHATPQEVSVSTVSQVPTSNTMASAPLFYTHQKNQSFQDVRHWRAKNGRGRTRTDSRGGSLHFRRTSNSYHSRLQLHDAPPAFTVMTQPQTYQQQGDQSSHEVVQNLNRGTQVTRVPRMSSFTGSTGAHGAPIQGNYCPRKAAFPVPPRVVDQTNQQPLQRIVRDPSTGQTIFETNYHSDTLRNDSGASRGTKTRCPDSHRGRGTRSRYSFGADMKHYQAEDFTYYRHNTTNFNEAVQESRGQSRTADSWRRTSEVPKHISHSIRNNEDNNPERKYDLDLAVHPTQCSLDASNNREGQPYNRINKFEVVSDKVSGSVDTTERLHAESMLPVEPDFELRCTKHHIGRECYHVQKLIVFDIPIEAKDEGIAKFLKKNLININEINRLPIRKPLYDHHSLRPPPIFVTFQTHADAVENLRRSPLFWSTGQTIRIEVPKEFWDPLYRGPGSQRNFCFGPAATGSVPPYFEAQKQYPFHSQHRPPTDRFVRGDSSVQNGEPRIIKDASNASLDVMQSDHGDSTPSRANSPKQSNKKGGKKGKASGTKPKNTSLTTPAATHKGLPPKSSTATVSTEGDDSANNRTSKNPKTVGANIHKTISSNDKDQCPSARDEDTPATKALGRESNAAKVIILAKNFGDNNVSGDTRSLSESQVDHSIISANPDQHTIEASVSKIDELAQLDISEAPLNNSPPLEKNAWDVSGGSKSVSKIPPDEENSSKKGDKTKASVGTSVLVSNKSDRSGQVDIAASSPGSSPSRHKDIKAVAIPQVMVKLATAATVRSPGEPLSVLASPSSRSDGISAPPTPATSAPITPAFHTAPSTPAVFIESPDKDDLSMDISDTELGRAQMVTATVQQHESQTNETEKAETDVNELQTSKKQEKPKGPAQTESLNPFGKKQTQKKLKEKRGKSTLKSKPKNDDQSNTEKANDRSFSDDSKSTTSRVTSDNLDLASRSGGAKNITTVSGQVDGHNDKMDHMQHQPTEHDQGSSALRTLGCLLSLGQGSPPHETRDDNSDAESHARLNKNQSPLGAPYNNDSGKTAEQDISNESNAQREKGTAEGPFGLGISTDGIKVSSDEIVKRNKKSRKSQAKMIENSKPMFSIPQQAPCVKGTSSLQDQDDNVDDDGSGCDAKNLKSATDMQEYADAGSGTSSPTIGRLTPSSDKSSPPASTSLKKLPVRPSGIGHLVEEKPPQWKRGKRRGSGKNPESSSTASKDQGTTVAICYPGSDDNDSTAGKSTLQIFKSDDKDILPYIQQLLSSHGLSRIHIESTKTDDQAENSSK